MRPLAIQAHQAAEEVSGWALCGMLVFSPWAFGTTEAWSIRAMTIGGISLGLLLGLKLWARRWGGYHPPSWEAVAPDGWTRALGAVTALALGWCFLSAWNASSTWQPEALRFEYHRHLPWLPHSLDAARSWEAFWMYAGLGGAFWGLWDWLGGKTAREARASGNKAMPERLKLILWLLAVNGATVALMGFAQRVEGSGRLLFAVQPRVNPNAVAQFGPWAYRANAAAWFNLLWPVVVGFWWRLGEEGAGRSRHWALACAGVMAAAAFGTGSRGGVAVAGALSVTVAAGIVLAAAWGGTRRRNGSAVGAVTGVAALAGAAFLGGWAGAEVLESRVSVEELRKSWELREELYDRARPIARDYRWYGTGPGTFEAVFQFYRESAEEYWPAQLHNDWLETRITFGLAGMILVALAPVLAVGRWVARGGKCGRLPGLLACLALLGCLAHARFDFPLQVHSVALAFLVVSLVVMRDLGGPDARCAMRGSEVQPYS